MFNISGLNAQEKNIINDVHQLLLETKQNNSIPTREKSKIYVCLAYEMFLIDLEEEGFRILELVDQDYFEKYLQEDMSSDSQYYSLVMYFLEKLIEIGYVKIKV